MDVKSQTANMLKDNYGILPEVTMALFEDDVLTEYQARKALIRDRFFKQSSKLKITELKVTLAQQFCVSLSTVEKYIASK